MTFAIRAAIQILVTLRDVGDAPELSIEGEFLDVAV
jgi:hypothetical protein